MFSFKHKNGFLLLLVAMVLLLQSFAVWHDVEHHFHDAQAQCERLNAINHVPVLDLVTAVDLNPNYQFVFFETTSLIYFLPAQRSQPYFIRGPPYLA